MAGVPSRSGLPVTAIALFAPCVLLYTTLFIWPQALLLGTSFVDAGGVSAANYRAVLADEYYWELLGRTFILGAGVTVVTLVLGLPVAYVLARMQSRWSAFLLLLTTFPMLVSAVVRSFGWMVLFFRNGLISQMLVMLGVSPRSSQLMYTLTGVVIALAQVLLPLMVLTLYGVFRSIDRDLEYAAMSLGARPATALWLVTLRLARGGIIAGSLLVFALSISTFATPSLVGGVRAGVMATAIFEQSIELLNWPLAATLATILLVCVFAVAMLYAGVMGREGGAASARA